ncbi:hypothetical protein IB286_02130 [Spongiibacter sp. KMU-158]|uniref:Uncharacterized protein n=1 Tax=Spongiibacter pelagi TaxID=2760804 RepID=A0A927BYA4_9GAMM|nr:hypothetical protein [Spongiibacter pelagi]MBD2857788.1 hypothetical protein [Spongiibacter pelagi]
MRKQFSALALALMVAPALAEDCHYPDTDQGTAPAWVCGHIERDDVYFTAMVERSRLPSISLQSRLAGREAMAAVTALLMEDARTSLMAELPEGTELRLPDADDIERLARFEGIRILEKSKSPRRSLFVLAGVEQENVERLKQQARVELLQENRVELQATIGQSEFDALLSTARTSKEK